MYAYFDASVATVGNVARLISPMIPEEYTGKIKCLSFQVVMYGAHIGYLHVLDEFGQVVWSHTGGEFNHVKFDHSSVYLSSVVVLCLAEPLDQYRTMWHHEYIQLPVMQRLIVFEVQRGGSQKEDDDGDVCLDNIKVIAEECCK